MESNALSLQASLFVLIQAGNIYYYYYYCYYLPQLSFHSVAHGGAVG
jgi:hypothetical protein